MDILEEIVQHKRREVEERKSLYPVKLLEQSIYFPAQPVSLKRYLLREDKTGIIAEFKRRSPSKGIINSTATVERTSIGYMQAGASALSVLTDQMFFGGSNDDLTVARKFNFCPVLRKDFIVDEYQVIEAKAIGADAILLIAAILTVEDCRRLATLATSFGLEVLLEVHGEQEVDNFAPLNIALMGVNNRNLKDFSVSLDVSKRLAERIPASVVKVSESGIDSPGAIIDLKSHGYRGFLLGEHFMKHSRPEKAALEFMTALLALEQSELTTP